jgi:transcriptional regulator with XRE-family HTH domain
MTIGEKIKKARTDAKMTQKELAEKCGMADSAIRKYESGKVTPKLDTIAKIARAMGLYAGDLVDAGQWGQVQPGEDSETASAAESQLIYHFRTLNDNGQTVAVERVQELTQIPAYQRRAEPTQTAPSAPDEDPAKK